MRAARCWLLTPRRDSPTISWRATSAGARHPRLCGRRTRPGQRPDRGLAVAEYRAALDREEHAAVIFHERATWCGVRGSERHLMTAASERQLMSAADVPAPAADSRSFLLQRVQPAMTGLVDLTGRGNPYLRGSITGAGTFLGGILRTLPFLIPDRVALVVAVRDRVRAGDPRHHPLAVLPHRVPALVRLRHPRRRDHRSDQRRSRRRCGLSE
jgi:hypothetical protein